MNKILELLLKDAKRNYLKRKAWATYREAPCCFCELAKQEMLLQFSNFKRRVYPNCVFCLLPIELRKHPDCIEEGKKILEAMESYFED